MKRTEHTQKWLDALRSGEYKQGTGYLKSCDGYCCLGVGAKIAGIPIIEDYEAYEMIMRTFGMDDVEKGVIAQKNDSERWTFPQIADEIEKMLDVS